MLTELPALLHNADDFSDRLQKLQDADAVTDSTIAEVYDLLNDYQADSPTVENAAGQVVAEGDAARKLIAERIIEALIKDLVFRVNDGIDIEPRELYVKLERCVKVRSQDDAEQENIDELRRQIHRTAKTWGEDIDAGDEGRGRE